MQITAHTRPASVRQPSPSNSCASEEDVEARLERVLGGTMMGGSDAQHHGDPRAIAELIRADALGEGNTNAAPEPRVGDVARRAFGIGPSETELQGRRIAELEAKLSSLGERADTLERRLGATGKFASAAFDTQVLEIERTRAINRVKGEVKTAPPSLSDVLKDVILIVANAVSAGIAGAVQKSLELSKLGAFIQTAKGAALVQGLSAAATGSVSAGVEAATKHGGDDDAFFEGLKEAAYSEMGAYIDAFKRVGLAALTTADPEAITEALTGALTKAASAAFETQYEATLGQYYEHVAVQDSGLVGIGVKRTLGDRDNNPDGLLVLEGAIDGFGRVTLDDLAFDGVRDKHEEHVARTELDKLRVPVRLELEATVGHGADRETFDVTILRSNGIRQLVGDESLAWWAAMRAQSRAPYLATPDALAEHVFRTLGPRSPRELVPE